MTPDPSHNRSINSSRRQFLKVGLLGSTILAAAAGGIVLSRKSKSCGPCLWLHQDDREFLKAVVPVMLAGALPEDSNKRIHAIDEVIIGFDFTVAHFPPTVRAEIRQLLWLLESPLTRPLLTGVWSGWHKAEVADIQDFLNRWKDSRLDLLRVGYTALHDLIVGAWYANPLSWQRINYPGPPVLK